MQHDNNEFFKLDAIDRKLLFWMMDHSRKEIRSWIEYISVEYKKTKNVEINLSRLQKEIEEETGKLF